MTPNILTPTLIFPVGLTRATFSGSDRNRHRLGGPLELDIEHWPRRGHSPHRIATLDPMDPAFGLGTRYHSPIPLIYGLQISGCRLRYQLNGHRKVKIQECQGQPAKNWPYAGYPEMLPTVPLHFQAPEPIDWKALEEDEDFHGLTNQDSRPKANEVLLVVPPNDTYGVSLWGLSGDRERVQIVFRINLDSFSVEAWNEAN